MATTTHFLQAYGTGGTSTAQFKDAITIPTGKIAKVKITSLTVQNTTSAAENYNWRAGIYCVTPRPDGTSTEVLLDNYRASNYQSNFSHYVITPYKHGDGAANSSQQNGTGQDTYNDYSPNTIQGNNGASGMFNSEFYLNQGEILRFMWRYDVGGMTDYEFFLRGFYLLEDVTS
jgi:hypothetical protein